jgi:response regulator NasT
VKVLLADSDADRAAAIERDLQGVELVRLVPGESLREAVAHHRPDVVLIDMTLPDRDALDGLRRVEAPIVLFVDQDDPGFMEAAIDAGISSYNVVGASLPAVKPIVAAAVALYRRHRADQTERAAIDRAKALLIRTRGLSEPDAHRWLRRRAMDRGKRIADIAAAYLAGDEA